ncbi:hypothetical protein [Blattabacterium cuenoti]|nr:hypothetical protein [Blattabacterium cuenoti]
MCKEENIIVLNGHIFIGRYIASIYNALSLNSIKLLIDIMKEFENKFI